MNILGSLRFAFRGITANKLRSMLTTLGILIGVAAVIVLLSVGTGSSAAVKKSIARLGTETLTVNRSAGGNGRAGTAAGGAGAGGFGGGGFAAARGGGGRTASSGGTSAQSTALTITDAAALLAPGAAPDVADDAPVITVSGVTGGYTGVTHTVSTFVGTTPSYLPINNWTIQAGSSFADADYTSRSDVAVIGTTDADDLFGTPAAAVGKTAQFNGKNFTIVGVLTAKGSTGLQDQDDIVIIPLTTAQDEFSGVTASLSSIIVRTKSASVVNTAQNQIYTVLDARHDVTATTRDYTVLPRRRPPRP
jgi:putative ABC transport system permease protein